MGSPVASTRGEAFHAVSGGAGSTWRLLGWPRPPWAALVAGKGLADFILPSRNGQATTSFGSAFLQPGEQGKRGCNPMIAQPCTHALQAVVTVPQTSHADPRLPRRELLVCLAMATSVYPGSKYTSIPWGRDVWSYCGSTGYDRSAQASGKGVRPHEFGFAVEGSYCCLVNLLAAVTGPQLLGPAARPEVVQKST